MSDNKIFELSHIAFAVLGLISEQPSHGKDINKKIEERGMRNWTAIGKSSIYGVLKILKDKGLVDSWIEEEDNRIVKVYKITDYGTDILKNKIYAVLSEFCGHNDENFYVAFSMIPFITPEKVIEAITHSIKKIKAHLKDLETMLEENSQQKLHVRGLFIHPIEILRTDIEFLEGVLVEIKNEGGKNVQ